MAMANGSRGSVVRSFQTLLDSGSAIGLTDGELLDRFLGGAEGVAEPAFAALVQAHGPMVWAVCRGALNDFHDAEDAFQATFLVLARKGNSVRRRGNLGPWLYGVARRVAIRAGRSRRQLREKSGRGAESLAAIPSAAPSHHEEVELLHQELDRLPDAYRTVVVLCHLEGHTHAEAARLLRCPVGTVNVRASRARQILRSRLTRRGVALSAAISFLEGTSEASAALAIRASVVPTALTAATTAVVTRVGASKSLVVEGVSAAVYQLTQGVLGTMTFHKLAIATGCVMALGLTSTSVGLYALSDRPVQGQGQDTNQPRPALIRAADPLSDDETTDSTKHQTAASLGAEDDGPPMGWGGGGPGYELIRDEDIKHGGTSSGTIRSKDQPLNGFGTFTQGIRADNYRGKRIKLSAFVKSRRLNGKAGLWMRVDGKTKSPLAFDNMMNRPIQGTKDWTEYSVVLDIAQDAQNIFFGFLMAGKGQTWVDDMKIEIVDNKTKVTGLKVEPAEQEINQSIKLPEEPVNLGFDR